MPRWASTAFPSTMFRPMFGCCRHCISTSWRRWPMCFGLTASASMSLPSSARRWSLASSRLPIRPLRKCQPGPRDYNRTQAEGDNVIADALAPHGGIVFWRAFVYSEKDPTDRAKQAYNEFKPLDGKFRDNVRSEEHTSELQSR